MQLITDTPLTSYIALDPIAQRTLKAAQHNHTTLALDAYLANLQNKPWYSYELDYVLSHDEKVLCIAYKVKDPITVYVNNQLLMLPNESKLKDYGWERSEALFETLDMGSLVHDVIADMTPSELISGKAPVKLGYYLFYLSKEDCYLAFKEI